MTITGHPLIPPFPTPSHHTDAPHPLSLPNLLPPIIYSSFPDLPRYAFPTHRTPFLLPPPTPSPPPEPAPSFLPFEQATLHHPSLPYILSSLRSTTPPSYKAPHNNYTPLHCSYPPHLQHSTRVFLFFSLSTSPILFSSRYAVLYCVVFLQVIS